MANVESSGGPCPPVWTVYDTFAAQQSDPNRPLKGTRDKENELLLTRDLELKAAREAASDAIRRVLRGHFGKAIERQVTASFDYLRSLRSLIEQAEVQPGLLDNMVRSQDRHLIQATTSRMPLPEGKFILVAFSVVEDQTITLTRGELNRLIQEVARREGKSDADVRREARRRADTGINARGGRLDDEVWDGIDILAHVLVLMRREGLKPAVKDPALQQWLVDYFAATSSTEKTFGGAAGNETFMLRALGLPVLLHVPYHHNEQATIAPDCANRLVFGAGGPIKPFPSIKSGNPNDARRFSFVFQLTPEVGSKGNIIGPTFRVDGENYRPIRPDRVILRIPNPRTDTTAGWNKLRVSWKGDPSWGGASRGVQWDTGKRCWFVEVDRSALRGFLDNDLPYIPVFQHTPKVDPSTQTLIIELASTDEMRQIAGEVQVALLGGIQGLGKIYYTRELTELLREALVEQLQALSSQGASLHLELSGVESRAVLDVLKDLLKRSDLRHISLNREELVQMTSEFGSPYFTSPRTSVPDTPIGIYFRTAELLRRLEMDTVYVHDIELDILVRRNVEGEDPVTGAAALERHRQAMLLAKAAMPAVLIQRAKAPQDWELVLSTESLAALLAFAKDYSALVASAVPTVNRDAVLSAVLTNSYYYPGENNVSVAVAPAIYVDFPSAVSLSGAGDMCFAAREATAG